MKVKTLIAVVMSFGLLAFVAACDDDDGGNNNAGPVCGNGIIEEGEACDGTNLPSNASCPSGKVGTPGCSDDCQQVVYDAPYCLDPAEACGNGKLDKGEDCDGDLFKYESCQAYNDAFTGGTLACTADCKIDTSNCTADYRHDMLEECNPGAKHQEFECAPHNDMPSECLPLQTGSGLCLQTCGNKADCGYSMDCIIPNQTTGHNLCLYGLCGPGAGQFAQLFGNQLNAACKFSDNSTGFCVPLWHAMDQTGVCFENGTVEHGGTCDATDYFAQAGWPKDKVCNAGNCLDIDKDGQGTCLSFCDPVGVYNAFVAAASELGDATQVTNWQNPDTCPAGFACINLSDLDFDAQNPDGTQNTMMLFRTADQGFCYPASEDVTVDGSNIDPLVTCDLISQRKIQTGELCGDGMACRPIAFGSLMGACVEMGDGSPLTVGSECDPKTNGDLCEAGTVCYFADPYNDPNWDNLYTNDPNAQLPATKCVKICQVDDLNTGKDDTDPACGTDEVCLSLSNFFTQDHGLPTGTDPQGQNVTEKSPTPFGLCVPKASSN